MLIYTKDILYNNRIMRINTLNDSEYKDIINKCNEAIYEYEMQNKINEEMEENKYKEFIKEQQEIENEIKRRARYESYLKKKRPENDLALQNKEIKQKINFEENNKENKDKKENEENKENKENNYRKNEIKEEKTILRKEIKKR